MKEMQRNQRHDKNERNAQKWKEITEMETNAKQ